MDARQSFTSPDGKCQIVAEITFFKWQVSLFVDGQLISAQNGMLEVSSWPKRITLSGNNYKAEIMLERGKLPTCEWKAYDSSILHVCPHCGKPTSFEISNDRLGYCRNCGKSFLY